MANLSDAYGVYFFDFNNTKLRGDHQAQENFINGLHCITSQYDGDGDYRTYYTDFDVDCIRRTDDDDVLSVGFGACGRWDYSCNVAWYTNNETDEGLYLSSLVGLIVTIDYQDAEPASGEIYVGQIKLKVKDGKTVIVENNVETIEYNAENAVRYGFYESVDDFNEVNSW